MYRFFVIYCYVLPNKCVGKEINLNSMNLQGENDGAGEEKV